MKPLLSGFLRFLAFIPLAAHGGIVTTLLDEDDGSLGGGSGISLREAVKYPLAGDTITFAPALSGQTIRLTLGEILIARSLTINSSALATRVTISGDKTGNGKTADDTNVFRVGANTIVLDSLIISGGYESQGGGIISNRDTANLTVKRCHFAGNSADVVGGAIFFSKSTGAGTPVLTLSNCTFTGNSATNEGGAIYAIYPVQIETSTFTGNTARLGGAIFLQASSGPTSVFQDSVFTGNSSTTDGGAICLTRGAIHLKRSTVAGNSALRNGGGISSEGQFIYLENSTVSGNSAVLDGGGVYSRSGYTTLRTSTIAKNSAGSEGGGICVLTALESEDSTIAANTAAVSGGGLAFASAYLSSTIVSGNSAPSSPQITGPIEGGSGNLITNILSLAPLGNYGGLTQTMPPIIGSPAVDPLDGTSFLNADQRGFPRDNERDIGAVEYRESDASITSQYLPLFWNNDDDHDGLPYAMERLHGTQPFLTDTASTSTLSLSAADSAGHPVLTFSIADDHDLLEHRTLWKLMRSSNLHPGSFHEIYRYTVLGATAIPGVTAVYSPDPADETKQRVTITDTNSNEEGRAFYRFEAVLDSH